jgi:nucleoid-associated protein EbfC
MANGPNMADMFGKFMDMQRKVSEVQEALAAKTVTAEAGGGMVTVTANGTQRITAISIERDAVDPDDLELLEDLIIAGINKALDEAAELAQREMREAAGGLLPPGFDLGQLGI